MQTKWAFTAHTVNSYFNCANAKKSLRKRNGQVSQNEIKSFVVVLTLTSILGYILFVFALNSKRYLQEKQCLLRCDP